MTGEEKAALLLLSLDPQVAQAVLGRLGPTHGPRLRRLMDQFGSAPGRDAHIAQVVREAADHVPAPALRIAQPEAPRTSAVPLPPSREASPPAAPAQNLVNAAPAAQDSRPRAEAERCTAAPGPAGTMPGDKDPVAALNQLPAAILAQALEGESVRTVSLVVNYLDTDLAGAVFQQLPAEVRREATVQLSTCILPGAAVVQRIVRAVLDKGRALRDKPPEPKGNSRFKKMAEILRRLERAERTEALAALQERDPAAAAAVSENLYVFEDLLVLDDRSVQKVLAEVDSKTLAIALKTAAEEIRNKALANLSKRGREALEEEMNFLPTLPATQVQQAQKALVDTVQRLDQVGELVMLR